MSTKTQIDRPDEEEQAAQVATLISGTEITDAALESARELMATGRQGE
jgi:DNA repair protein RecN (Recombination protein N)